MTLAAVAAAVAGRWLLDPIWGDELPYPTFFVAVVIGAWVGGLSSALLATALGFLFAWYFFVPPRFSFFNTNGPHLVGLAMYLMVSMAIAAFGEAMRVAQRRLEGAADILAEQRERLRVTLSSIGDAVLTTDREGKIAYMNAVAESLTGWTQTEAAGRPLEDIFRIINRDTRRQVEDPVKKVLAHGNIVGLANHTVLIAKDGTERPIDDSAAPIRNEQGELAGVVLIFRDITERERAERLLYQSESRKAAIIRAALDCIVKIDHVGQIIEFNPAAEQTFGYRREDVMGQQMAEYGRAARGPRADTLRRLWSF